MTDNLPICTERGKSTSSSRPDLLTSGFRVLLSSCVHYILPIEQPCRYVYKGLGKPCAASFPTRKYAVQNRMQMDSLGRKIYRVYSRISRFTNIIRRGGSHVQTEPVSFIDTLRVVFHGRTQAFNRSIACHFKTGAFYKLADFFCMQNTLHFEDPIYLILLLALTYSNTSGLRKVNKIISLSWWGRIHLSDFIFLENIQ